MNASKHQISKLELGLLSSLSESYTLLPFMIFSSLLSKDISTVNFFVPVLILYSIERACIIGLRGFGEISNPYKIIKCGLLITLVGAIMMLLSPLYRPLLMLSALLIGIGLAPYRAMFTPIYIIITEEEPKLKKSKIVGTIFYLSIMVLTLVFGKNELPLIPIIFFVYILLILLITTKLRSYNLFDNNNAFDSSKRSPVFFIFGILALMSLLILRQYQLSGVSVYMWLTPIAAMIFILVEMYRRRHYRDYSFKTYFVGAVKSFVMLFSLVYHTSVGNTSMAMLVYIAIAVSGVFSSIIKKILLKIGIKKLSNPCLILSAGSLILLIIPNSYLNLIGIVLSEAFANIVSSDANRKYLCDDRYVKEERSLVRTRIQTTGSILEQLILFFIIFMLGEIKVHQNLLEPYATKTPNAEIGALLHFAGLICIALLVLGSVVIVCISNKMNKRKEHYYEQK